MQPVLWALCALWAMVNAIAVESPKEALRAARGRSVTLPCTYHTSASDRQGLIQWDKLLRSHSERVVTWTFSTKSYFFGNLYENRVSMAANVEQSDASITIDQLTMEDNGTYECSVSLLSDLQGISKARVQLLVLVPPSKPDCQIVGETVMGSSIQLTCRSAEGSPAPEYRWTRFSAQHQERPLPAPATGQTLSLKNISSDTSGFYICSASNEIDTASCNITVAVRPPSMNVALYAGIAGGVIAALILIGIVAYCCCCRDNRNAEKESARPGRAAYQEPAEQLRELSRARKGEEEEEEDPGQEEQRSPGRRSPDHLDQ